MGDITVQDEPSPPPLITRATVRDGDEEWHIECSFSNGQKYAAIQVDKEDEWIADLVCNLLNDGISKEFNEAWAISSPDGKLVIHSINDTDFLAWCSLQNWMAMRDRPTDEFIRQHKRLGYTAFRVQITKME